jgi:hypothetical protein
MSDLRELVSNHNELMNVTKQQIKSFNGLSIRINKIPNLIIYNTKKPEE